jgi:hypothetical protein
MFNIFNYANVIAIKILIIGVINHIMMKLREKFPFG